jgi:hypothetical protein
MRGLAVQKRQDIRGKHAFVGHHRHRCVFGVSQTASAQSLSPGKPAGVREARHGASTGLLIAGGVLVAGLVAVLVYTNGGNNNGIVTNGSAATTS